MSFFNKLTTLVAGTSHDILDKAIDLNSPTMLRQYARDLEAQVEVLNGEAATAAGQVRTATRERDNIDTQISTNLTNGKKLKEGTLPDKDSRMQKIANDIVNLRQTLAVKQQALDSQISASAQLDLVLGKVKAKSNEINARIKALESMDTASKAKAHAADVITKTASLLDNTSSSSIDDIESKIRSRNDIADVKLDRAIGSFNDKTPEPDTVAINDVMNEF